MHPKQNPKKTRGKGGKKERKRRDEMKKYALIVTQESQPVGGVFHGYIVSFQFKSHLLSFVG